MQVLDQLNVRYNGSKVGNLTRYNRQFLAFTYDDKWLIDGFSISPFSLPLEKKVYIPNVDPFNGIFGIFADSLPDGWGRLLVDRFMLKQGLNPLKMGNVDRLALVGMSGMGALTYEPVVSFETPMILDDLDQMATECGMMLKTEYSDNLDDLFQLGGSSGGARPKILTTIDGEDWIIKFPSSYDKSDIGLQEYRYSLCAKKCGITMAETRLFDSKLCAGYFGTKRFDRTILTDGTIKRNHMISASALLETSHRIPNLDYDILMSVTKQLTQDKQQIEDLYRLMCFNVFAHNRDDHSKNFTFLYDDDCRKWILSPAYDLTYSASIGGEHATMVHGNGENPGFKDIFAVAEGIGMNHGRAKGIAEMVRTCVSEELGL